MHAAVGAAALVFSLGSMAIAQTTNPFRRTLELRLPSGAFVARGVQRQQLKDAQVTAAQVSWFVDSQLAFTGTFAWTGTRDLAATDTPKLDVFTADLGAELRSSEWHAERPVSVRAFAGLGGGARVYNYRSLDRPATNNLAGYGSIGSEVGMGRVRLRVEARNYVSGFKPLAINGRSGVRNDVAVLASLRFNRRRVLQPQD